MLLHRERLIVTKDPRQIRRRNWSSRLHNVRQAPEGSKWANKTPLKTEMRSGRREKPHQTFARSCPSQVSIDVLCQ